MNLSLFTSTLQYFSKNVKLSTLQEEDENYESKENSAKKLINDISNEKGSKSINEVLLQYKEIKYFYNITGIQPKYVLYILSVILLLFIINYFSKLFTLIVGVIYPMQCSIKVMRERKKAEIRKWLEYWIIFFLFFNIETAFGNFLEKIPMYLFYKTIFLLVCFLPWYNGAHYIYNSWIRTIFLSYEKDLYKYSLRFARRISKNIYKD